MKRQPERTALERMNAELARAKADLAKAKADLAKFQPETPPAAPQPDKGPDEQPNAGGRATAERERTRITPPASLEGTLVSYLGLRDFALWAFVLGVGSDDPLPVVDLEQIRLSVEQMNALRGAALHFAQQTAGKNDPVAVLKTAMERVKKLYQPAFTLSLGPDSKHPAAF